MTVSNGVEGQLISEARICIYSDIKALSLEIKTAPSLAAFKTKLKSFLKDQRG